MYFISRCVRSFALLDSPVEFFCLPSIFAPQLGVDVSYLLKRFANYLLLLLSLNVFLDYRKFFMNKKPPEVSASYADPVSILKPLKGLDPNLQVNLETFFNLNYPKVCIILSTLHCF